MTVSKKIDKQEELKEKILKSEEIKNYNSKKFSKIENKVKDSLTKQKTDEALKDITI
jgi:hypothetical protein